MKFDIEKIKKYEKDGWIYSQSHPSLPLKIYNYSQATQYNAYWDEITLNCRGLVLDEKGNVVSKGFAKFFNYSEGRTNIPEKIEYVEVWEKMDGSYIGLFYYENNWIINSKGSFKSDQAEWAKDILLEGKFDLNTLNKNWTYCFELIVPQNRIVCDYGDEKSLYFLSSFCKGKEIDNIYPKELQETIIKFPKLVQLNKLDVKRLQEQNKNNEEGYVVKFTNGERCKIKFDEYIRLHGIVTNTTSYDIWKCLMNGDDFNEILDRVPDEFYKWVRNTKEELESLWNFWETSIKGEYKLVKHIETDKEFAEKVKYNKFKSFLFSLRNGRDISQQIWKNIKPEFKKAFQI